MPTLATLAEELAVDQADIAVLVRGLTTRRVAEPAAPLSANVAAGVRGQLNPNGERTRLDLYWPDADAE
jgi:hypothetical protein